MGAKNILEKNNNSPLFLPPCCIVGTIEVDLEAVLKK
jgi:hypothetical protein